MNIALIRQRYTAYGGAERFVARAMAALEQDGAQLTLVTRRWDQPDRPALVCNPFYLGSLWRDWGFARRVCATLASQRFDLVQSHERIACCDVYRAGDGVHREWLRQRARVLGPLKRLSLRLSLYHRYTLAAERALFTSPRLRAVICNSQMVAREIRDHFRVAEHKLHVIYSGLDTTSFHPDLRAHRATVRAQRGIDDRSIVFLFVGSGFERKGLAVALDALASLPPHAQLLVVGKDRHIERYRAQARRLGIESRVHFAGAQREVGPYYGAADAFVLPTLYDPCPNAALEAMACALPIVTSTSSGAAELALAHEAGLVCDAGDARALAGHMRALLDPALRGRLGERARIAVLPLTGSAMTARLLALYGDLLDRELYSHASSR